jgi:hypothetical protein
VLVQRGETIRPSRQTDPAPLLIVIQKIRSTRLTLVADQPDRLPEIVLKAAYDLLGFELSVLPVAKPGGCTEMLESDLEILLDRGTRIGQDREPFGLFPAAQEWGDRGSEVGRRQRLHPREVEDDDFANVASPKSLDQLSMVHLSDRTASEDLPASHGSQFDRMHASSSSRMMKKINQEREHDNIK